LSFVTPDDESVLAEVQEAAGEENPLKPFDINVEEMEGFRYRCEVSLCERVGHGQVQLRLACLTT